MVRGGLSSLRDELRRAAKRAEFFAERERSRRRGQYPGFEDDAYLPATWLSMRSLQHTHRMGTPR